MKNKEEKSLLIENVPSGVKADFKAACATARTSMRKEILRHMKNFALKTKNGLRVR